MQPLGTKLMNSFVNRLKLKDKGETLEMDWSYMPIMQEDALQQEQAFNERAQGLSLLLKDGVISKELYAKMIDVEYKPVDELQSQLDKILNSQVELRGTVGGVDGLISINAAVAAQQLDRESAVQILISVYGFDPTAAGKMITTKVTPEKETNNFGNYGKAN